jgi:hypothetical protein
VSNARSTDEKEVLIATRKKRNGRKQKGSEVKKDECYCKRKNVDRTAEAHFRL